MRPPTLLASACAPLLLHTMSRACEPLDGCNARLPSAASPMSGCVVGQRDHCRETRGYFCVHVPVKTPFDHVLPSWDASQLTVNRVALATVVVHLLQARLPS